MGVGHLRNNGDIFTQGEDKARVLNSQFGSIFSIDKGENPIIQGQCTNSSINNIVINTEGIVKLLNQLNSNKASGPDNISARFLRETSSEIAPALAFIFQASLYQQCIPEDWRKAYVTPVYKSGKKDRSKAENYRPISHINIL